MPVVVEIVTMPEQPKAGDTVRWEVSFVNAGAEAVRVPSDAIAKLEVEAWWQDPHASIALGYGRMSTSAGALAWTTLAPGERVVREGEACSRCTTGTWAVRIAGPRWAVADAAADQALPELPPPATFTVASRIVPVEAGLSASAKAHLDGDAVVVDVKVKNTSSEAMWVPDPEHWHLSCSYAYTSADGSSGGAGLSGSIDTWLPLGDDQAVLLGPGRSLRVPLGCGSGVAGADSATVRLRLRPSAPIAPTEPTEAVRVFAGTLEVTAPVR